MLAADRQRLRRCRPLKAVVRRQIGGHMFSPVIIVTRAEVETKDISSVLDAAAVPENWTVG